MLTSPGKKTVFDVVILKINRCPYKAGGGQRRKYINDYSNCLQARVLTEPVYCWYSVFSCSRVYIHFLVRIKRLSSTMISVYIAWFQSAIGPDLHMIFQLPQGHIPNTAHDDHFIYGKSCILSVPFEAPSETHWLRFQTRQRNECLVSKQKYPNHNPDITMCNSHVTLQISTSEHDKKAFFTYHVIAKNYCCKKKTSKIQFVLL